LGDIGRDDSVKPPSIYFILRIIAHKAIKIPVISFYAHNSASAGFEATFSYGIAANPFAPT
jgi:hypothetical protein